VFDFLTKKTTVHKPVNRTNTAMVGHGGGDYHLMNGFIEAIQTGDKSKICTPQQSLESHLVVFAAERARLEDTVVRLEW